MLDERRKLYLGGGNLGDSNCSMATTSCRSKITPNLGKNYTKEKLPLVHKEIEQCLRELQNVNQLHNSSISGDSQGPQ